MPSDKTNEQSSLDVFSNKQEPSTRTCEVCGFEHASTGATCHPSPQLARERDRAVTKPNDYTTGFAYPPHLEPPVRDLCEDIDAAIAASEKPPVTASFHRLRDRIDDPTTADLHLLWLALRQWGVLSRRLGYLVTDSEPNRTMQEILEDLPGRLASKLGKRDTKRIYRRKVDSYMPSGYTEIPLVETNSIWPDTVNESTIGFNTIAPTAVFDENTAHNAMTMRARNWTVAHPDIDWATAPHTMELPSDHDAFDHDATPETQSDTKPWMLDFVGYTAGDPSQVTVLGSVIGEETLDDLVADMAVIRETNAIGLLVFPNRDELMSRLEAIHDHGAIDGLDALTPTVSEALSRLPSITAINTELHAHSDTLTQFRCLTRKQLLDDIIHPVDVIPSGGHQE